MAAIQTFKRKILIVEDNELNREILVSILSDKYDTDEAENGQIGLDKVLKDPTEYSLIVLDIQMPVMNGFEFLEKFTQIPQLMRIPVIVTTAEKEEEEKCLTLGASDFVTKPFNPRIVLKRIEALIRLRESTFAIQQTMKDPISGLLNKEYFCYEGDTNLTKFKDSQYIFGLMQIEDFDFTNNIYGQETCDSLITFIGKKLSFVNPDVTFARYGGDKFTFFFDGKNVDTRELIQKIQNELTIDSPITNIKYKFALYENVNHDVMSHQIVNRLIGAVKKIFHNFLEDVVYFDDTFLKVEERKHLIEENMEESLANHDFVAFFQPKHDTKTGELKGAEALVRWFHPTLGFISPGDFIPTFEQNGFITKIDLYVLEETCKFLSERIASNKKAITVSINLSRRDLVLIENTEIFDEILNKYSIDKDLIHFEITESICGDAEIVTRKTKMIRDAGYKIEIDDFGTGYSSLGMIADVPMDYLKLDLSFIKKICSNKEFARTVFNIAHVLNVKTVAEGVETDEEINVCKELGCDYIQGYYFSKPLSPIDFTKYLEKELQ